MTLEHPLNIETAWNVITFINESLAPIQNEAKKLNISLQNRKTVVKELERILGNLRIPIKDVEYVHIKNHKIIYHPLVDSVLRRITRHNTSMAVDAFYQESAIQLDSLYERSKEENHHGIHCALEVMNYIEDLMKSNLCPYIYGYFSERLAALGKDGELASLAAIQQINFVPYATMFTFLLKYDEQENGPVNNDQDPNSYDAGWRGKRGMEFRREYAAKAESYYLNKTFKNALKQFKWNKLGPIAVKFPLIGGDITDTNVVMSKFGINRLPFSNWESSSRRSSLTLGPTSLEFSPTIVAAKTEFLQATEAIFRILLDAIHNEYAFVNAFMGFKNTFPFISSSRDNFVKVIFGKSVTAWLTRMDLVVDRATDITELLGLLGSLVSLESNNEEMPIKSFLEPFRLLLHGRISRIIKTQIESLEKAAIPAGLNDASYLVKISPVTKGFVEFLTLFSLNFPASYLQGNDNNNPFTIRKLFEAFLSYLDRCKTHAGIYFLLANLHYLILSLSTNTNPFCLFGIFSDSQDKLDNALYELVDDEIRTRFPSIIAQFDNHIEALEENIKEFNENIEEKIRSLISNVMKSFSDYRTTKLILDAFFNKLLYYYDKFFMQNHHQLESLTNNNNNNLSSDSMNSSQMAVSQKWTQFVPIPLSSLEKLIRTYHIDFTLLESRKEECQPSDL